MKLTRTHSGFLLQLQHAAMQVSRSRELPNFAHAHCFLATEFEHSNQ